jgi:hypothetical protein
MKKIAMQPDLFDTPLSVTKVRNGVNAYKYRNGNINIAGQIFSMYSISEAIRIWRHKNPAYAK